MANIKSAIKRAELAEIRTQRNRTVKTSVKTAARRVESALAAGDGSAAEQAYRGAASLIDKAVSKGVLHKNTAARKKARLAKRIASSKA